MQARLGDGVLITGMLPRDAETKSTTKGAQVTEFSVKAGERLVGENKEAIWVNCVAFGKTSDYAARLSKGDIVMVLGKTRVENYNDRAGNPKSATKLICEFI